MNERMKVKVSKSTYSSNFEIINYCKNVLLFRRKLVVTTKLSV